MIGDGFSINEYQPIWLAANPYFQHPDHKVSQENTPSLLEHTSFERLRSVPAALDEPIRFARTPRIRLVLV